MGGGGEGGRGGEGGGGEGESLVSFGCVFDTGALIKST